MHYTYPPEEYVKLLNEYLELGKTAFSPEDSQETVLNKLKQRTAELRRIADRANTMIGEYVEPFLKAPETMTASSAEALEAFLEVLFPSDSALGQDVAITYQVLKLLLDYYRDSGDYDEKKKKNHLLHMAIYIGNYFEGYEDAIIESVEGGVVIRTLSESERIHEAQYTYCGYFRGIDYDK